MRHVPAPSHSSHSHKLTRLFLSHCLFSFFFSMNCVLSIFTIKNHINNIFCGLAQMMLLNLRHWHGGQTCCSLPLCYLAFLPLPFLSFHLSFCLTFLIWAPLGIELNGSSVSVGLHVTLSSRSVIGYVWWKI